MGLDFSHCDASWSYGGFNRARTRLAAVIGIELEEMIGFGEFIGNGRTSGTKPWPSPDDQPLVHLLHHSDCDGVLTPEQCRVVAPALRAAVALWPEDDYDRIKFLELATGMDTAAACDEDLEFI